METPVHPRLESGSSASAQSRRRSRGGVLAFTLLLLIASVAVVPATRTARRNDGRPAKHAPVEPAQSAWILLPTALAPRVPYTAHDGGEQGRVLERGTTGWEIDWITLGTIWALIVGLGGILGLLFIPATRSERAS